eukprot:3599251-Pleurochrysis_carterae.AAC.1
MPRQSDARGKPDPRCCPSQHALQSSLYMAVYSALALLVVPVQQTLDPHPGCLATPYNHRCPLCMRPLCMREVDVLLFRHKLGSRKVSGLRLNSSELRRADDLFRTHSYMQSARTKFVLRRCPVVIADFWTAYGDGMMEAFEICYMSLPTNADLILVSYIFEDPNLIPYLYLGRLASNVLSRNQADLCFAVQAA